MRHAASWVGDSTQSNRPSPRRALTAALLLAATLASLLALGAAPASAEFRHKSMSFAFGTDGTEATVLGLPNALGYDQAERRLYGVSMSGPRHVYGWKINPAITTATPLTGAFPLEVESGFLSSTDLEVDNTALPSAGHFVYIRGSKGEVDVFNRQGLSLFEARVLPGGTKTDGTPTACGADFDNQGNIWVVNQNSNSLEVFKPTGGAAIRKIDFDPTPINRPCHIAIDHSNGDVYLAVNSSSVMRLNAANDFNPMQATAINTGEGVGEQASLAVNSLTHRLYVAPEFSPARSLNTLTGAVVEEEIGGFGHKGLAIDEATDTLFLSPKLPFTQTTTKIQVWKPVIVPDVTIGPPTADKTMTGTVKTAGGGSVTGCTFEYTATSFPGTTVACTPATPYVEPGQAVQPVSVNVPGLTNETTYSYRINVTNANGTNTSAVETITPHWVSMLRSTPATNLQRTTATLNGSFEGTGVETEYQFEFGPPNGAAGVYGGVGSPTTLENKGVTSGPTTISAGISGLKAGATYHFRAVGKSGGNTSKAQDLAFTTAPAVKSLETTPATNLEPDGATLNGSLDPDGIATTFKFEYGKTTGYGNSTAFEPVPTLGPGATPVSEPVTGLEPGTTYHFRVIAENSFGTTMGIDKTFTTARTPSIDAVSSDNLTATSANLTAIINPNGFATTYYFEYGTSLSYGAIAPVGTPGELAAGSTPEPVSVPISGLVEGRTYHFRLVAENEWGTTTSEDQTFDFNPPSGCPNHTVRQQTSSGYLPDCRAYELVSPARAGGAFLFPIGPRSPVATSPSRLSFVAMLNPIPDSGDPQSGSLNGDLYVSTRTDQGWKTHYVGIPADQGLAQSGIPSDESNSGFNFPPPPIEFTQAGYGDVPTDPTLGKYLLWDKGQKAALFNSPPGSTEGSFAPYMFDADGNFIRRLPTNLNEVPGGSKDVTQGGFRGDAKASADFSHYVFSTDNTAFAPEGKTTAPGSAYDNDIEAGTVDLISRTASGGHIPNGGNNPPFPEWIQIAAVSPDGSRVLMATMGTRAPNPPPVLPSTYRLYMRDTEANLSYEVSMSEKDALNHEIIYESATPDLSKVYFTSTEQLTNDDSDTSRDLFMWSENGGTPELTRLSTGSTGAAGNNDSCTATWITKCGVEVVPTIHKDFLFAEQFLEVGHTPRFDSAIAKETGEIYFYSPEQLDGTKGLAGLRNLYVFRDGAPQYVATLDPDKGASRIQVTPDGRWMAFITRNRVTGYNSETAAEMYRYNAETDSIICVSCPPDGSEARSQTEGSMNGLYLTNNGRVLFSTGDDLVPRDADGIRDVYEYVDGRAQLISSGRGDFKQNENHTIGLVSVSADGIDAFFATVDTLVGQDENGPYLKFYDARVNGGFPFTKPPSACAAADECHGQEASTPAPLTIGTGASLGSRGNAEPTKAKPKKKHCKKKGKHCKKQKRRNRGSGSRRNG